MKPTSNNKNSTEDNENAKAPVSIIELKGKNYSTVNDIKHFRRKIYNALVIHDEERCLMCTMSKWKFDNHVSSMGSTCFFWHLESLTKSNGQRLNREVMRDMYKSYRSIVERIRQHSTTNSATSVVVTIGVSA